VNAYDEAAIAHQLLEQPEDELTEGATP